MIIFVLGENGLFCRLVFNLYKDIFRVFCNKCVSSIIFINASEKIPLMYGYYKNCVFSS